MGAYANVCVLVEAVPGGRVLSALEKDTSAMCSGPDISQDLHCDDGIDRHRYREEEHSIYHRAESGDISRKNPLHVPKLVENSECVANQV